MAPVATNISNGRSGSKTVRLVERERVATLSGSADFTVQHTFKINPALSAFLPWLSTMAQLYEKYRVKSIRVMYHNLCGTSTAGNVLMSFDPDVLDSAPADAIAFSQSTRYVDGAPWRCITLNIPGSNQALFTRAATAPTGSDLKTYDYGQIHIATEAMADESTVGYIEIAYDIELMERQPAPVSGGGSYSFRPSVYVGVPDPTVLVNISHQHDGNSQFIEFDGVLPLKPLVDDIGVIAFNGALTLPVGAYFVNVSFPGSEQWPGSSVGGGPGPGQRSQSLQPVAISSDYVGADDKLAAKLAESILDSFKSATFGSNPGWDPNFPGSTQGIMPKYECVDSSGQPIDSVGFADLTGVALRCRFRLKVVDAVVAGRPLAGTGQFSTYMRPSSQGMGVWPAAVITKIGGD